MEEKEMYSLNSCLWDVKNSVEKLGEDPIRLLGKYTLRAMQAL